jgi:uncharacterized integral membrane protein
MKIVFWVFSVLAVVFTIDFVMTNGQSVVFGSWLFPWRIDLPVGLAVLCALAAGLVIGGFFSWGSGSRARRRARIAERRVDALERELGSLVRRAEEAEREAITVALPGPATPGTNTSTGTGTAAESPRAAAGAGRQ